jgi:hypothetical protein
MSDDSNHLKYDVNIEGTIYPWAHHEITPAQIRELGHLPENEPVLEVHLETNEERTLPDDRPVELRPGIGFAHKVEFKRGSR